MGLAARSVAPAEPRVFRLRLLRQVQRSRPQANGSRARAVRDARSLELFAVACLFMTVLAVFGIGRVMLTAKAAEASIDAGRLRADIKAERFTGDSLEADRSALATPSRIESIAGESLKMAQASQVSYLALPSVARAAIPGDSVDEVLKPPVGDDAVVPVNDVSAAAAMKGRTGVIAGILASVMELAAGEAHVLLLGDVGLATSR